MCQELLLIYGRIIQRQVLLNLLQEILRGVDVKQAEEERLAGIKVEEEEEEEEEEVEEEEEEEVEAFDEEEWAREKEEAAREKEQRHERWKSLGWDDYDIEEEEHRRRGYTIVACNGAKCRRHRTSDMIYCTSCGE